MLSLLGGAIVAIGLIGLVQIAAHTVYPPPQGLDYNDPAVLKTVMMNAPVGALLLVLLSYAVGTFVGAAIATRLSSPEVPVRQGYLVGALILAASVMNLRAIPHPLWFWIGNFVVVIAAMVLGTRFGYPKRAVNPTAAQS